MARLLSVNVGLPREISWRGQTVYTSVWKEPVQGRRLVRRLNVDGDAQGDLAGHGGEQRAVFVYQIDSYRYWERELKRSDFTFGQFGENFTVEGLADSEVCIGSLPDWWATECGRRRNSGAIHAACAGSPDIHAPGLVDFWRTEPGGSSLCPGSPRSTG